MKEKIIIGSRASELALVQTHWVIQRLKEKFPELVFEIVEIKTIGDKILDKTLNKIGGKGLFVKEIETALIQGEIDIAVHSMKDVPTEMPEQLIIGAITDREDVRDILIAREGLSIDELPKGARIGTSSLRRAAQLLAYRPDLRIEPIRGNIATRISKIQQLGLDGVVLAAAGILRLGWGEQITQYLPKEICIPAVGQGALGIQIRKEDTFIQSMVQELNNPSTALCIEAERSFMRTLKGGCHVPIGAYAYMNEEGIMMETIIAAPDGSRSIRLKEHTTNIQETTHLGINMANKSLNMGGKSILENIEVGE